MRNSKFSDKWPWSWPHISKSIRGLPSMLINICVKFECGHTKPSNQECVDGQTDRLLTKWLLQNTRNAVDNANEVFGHNAITIDTKVNLSKHLNVQNIVNVTLQCTC